MFLTLIPGVFIVGATIKPNSLSGAAYEQWGPCLREGFKAKCYQTRCKVQTFSSIQKVPSCSVLTSGSGMGLAFYKGTHLSWLNKFPQVLRIPHLG